MKNAMIQTDFEKKRGGDRVSREHDQYVCIKFTGTEIQGEYELHYFSYDEDVITRSNQQENVVIFNHRTVTNMIDMDKIVSRLSQMGAVRQNPKDSDGTTHAAVTYHRIDGSVKRKDYYEQGAQGRADSALFLVEEYNTLGFIRAATNKGGQGASPQDIKNENLKNPQFQHSAKGLSKALVCIL